MKLIAAAVIALAALACHAADYPAPKEGSWTVRDFRFHTGETLPELRLAYTTIGARDGRAGARAARHDRLGARAC